MTIYNLASIITTGILSLSSALFIAMCGVNLPAKDKKKYFIYAFLFSFIFRSIYIVYEYSLFFMFDEILWGYFLDTYRILIGLWIISYYIRHLFNKTANRTGNLLVAISNIFAIEFLILMQPLTTHCFTSPTIFSTALPEVLTIIAAVLLSAKALHNHLFLQKTGFIIMTCFGLNFILYGLHCDFDIWYSSFIVFLFFCVTIIYGRIKKEKQV